MNKLLITTALTVSALCASGNRNPTPANAVEVRVSSAVIPSGGTVQLQYSLTEPKPIMSTGSSFAMDSFEAWGISLWTPTGDACGVGTIANGKLSFAGIDPAGTLGTNTDYPFLTLTLRVPSGQPVGTVYPFSWDPGSYASYSGTNYDVIVKPGTVTIGGSGYISGVFPGGGTYPAGTVVHVAGANFSSQTKFNSSVKYSSFSISSNDIAMVLKETTKLDSQWFSVQNPDKTTVVYYSYLRGVYQQTPSRDLLKNAEYAFPISTHAVASVGPAPELTSSQFTALAMQNPNPGPAAVTLTLNSVAGQTSSLIVLNSGSRVVDTLSQLLGGVAVAAGDTVTLTSTATIQILGINGDEGTQSLTPFIPQF